MVPFAAVLRPTEYPDTRLFRDYHTYSRERCLKDAACTSNRFPLSSDTNHSACRRSTAGLLRTWRHDPVRLDPAWTPLSWATLASEEKDNLATQAPNWNIPLHSPAKSSVL